MATLWCMTSLGNEGVLYRDFNHCNDKNNGLQRN